MWIPRLSEQQAYEASGTLIRGYTITSFLHTGRLPMDTFGDFYDGYDYDYDYDYGYGLPPRRAQHPTARGGSTSQAGTRRRGGGRRKSKKNGKKSTTAQGSVASSSQPATEQAGATGAQMYPGGHTTYKDFMDDFYPEVDEDALDEERANNWGFTNDEVEELLCQGVKPWDDDAWVSKRCCTLRQ